MKIFDLISICLRNLLRRKVRTALTVVGVVVGSCAIVVMISLGLGMKASQEELLAQLGDLTVIQIYSYNSVDKDGNTLYLDDEKMAEIQAMNQVVAATPFYYPRYLDAQLYAGNNERYMTYFHSVVGVYPETLPLLGYELLEGSWEDVFSTPYSIVMGEYGAYNFEDTRKKRGNNRVNPYPDYTGEIPDPFVDVMGTKLLIRLNLQDASAKKIEYKPTVAAVMKEDWSRGYETSRGMFMSISDLKRMEEDYKKANKIKADSSTQSSYDNARVKVSDMKYVGRVEEAIQEMGFDTYSMETIRKPMEEQTQKQQTFLGIIAGVSLFVAALGIANTMLMSIYERTREIGVMKVVGCYVRDIRAIFLMEAGCIGFMGGVLGAALSCLISFLMNFFGLNLGMGGAGMWFGDMGTGAQVSIIPPWLIGLALVFSTLIGLVSGYYPANRAVKISALTAIKQE
jgi:ABC-type antimicrobial peptide transport system permease subunit